MPTGRKCRSLERHEWSRAPRACSGRYNAQAGRRTSEYRRISGGVELTCCRSRDTEKRKGPEDPRRSRKTVTMWTGSSAIMSRAQKACSARPQPTRLGDLGADSEQSFESFGLWLGWRDGTARDEACIWHQSSPSMPDAAAADSQLVAVQENSHAAASASALECSHATMRACELLRQNLVSQRKFGICTFGSVLKVPFQGLLVCCNNMYRCTFYTITNRANTHSAHTNTHALTRKHSDIKNTTAEHASSHTNARHRLPGIDCEASTRVHTAVHNAHTSHRTHLLHTSTAPVHAPNATHHAGFIQAGLRYAHRPPQVGCKGRHHTLGRGGMPVRYSLGWRSGAPLRPRGMGPRDGPEGWTRWPDARVR